MSNIDVLRDELTNDPLARGYAGMTAQQAADSLNTVNRTQNKTTLTGAEIYEAMDIAEFQAKTAGQQTFVRDIIGLGGNVSVGTGTKARAVLLSIFGGGSTTISALAAAIALPSISRAAELGLPRVGAHHVTEARA
jgi:hypothetical protein